MEAEKLFYRRDEAADYLKCKYGFGTTRTLAKLATMPGAGPVFRKASNAVLYERTELDRWAQSKISAETYTCAADHKAA